MARDVLADVTRKVPRIEVVAAAGRKPDQQIDVLALVELLDDWAWAGVAIT
jgi:hypothetical protein